MAKEIIRLLRADEIECRISVIRENGLSLLLYKDARVDQRILDETFGVFGWKRTHQCIDGNLYCTVEVYDKDTGIWVAKQDVGTTGYAEKEKSQASDSFKRACFNWGIGRELYSAPFIWIPSVNTTIRQNKDKLYCNDHFSVASIGYNKDREISSLVIVNASNKDQVVYELKEKTVNSQKIYNTSLSGEQMQSLEKELQRTGVGIDAVCDRYKIENPAEMPDDIYKRVMKALAKTKSKAA